MDRNSAVQDYHNWQHSEVGEYVVSFARKALAEVLTTNTLTPVRPVNMVILFGLLANDLPLAMGNLMRDLATYYYENPDRAAEAWDVIAPKIAKMS